MAGEYHAFLEDYPRGLTNSLNNAILSLEKDGVNRKGKLVVTRGRKVVHPLRKGKAVCRRCKGLIPGKFCLGFFLKFLKDAGQKRAKMFRIPRMRYQDRLDMFRAEDGKCKLIFTRIVLVSRIPRVVRIISIEKEVAVR